MLDSCFSTPPPNKIKLFFNDKLKGRPKTAVNHFLGVFLDATASVTVNPISAASRGVVPKSLISFKFSYLTQMFLHDLIDQLPGYPDVLKSVVRLELQAEFSRYGSELEVFRLDNSLEFQSGCKGQEIERDR